MRIGFDVSPLARPHPLGIQRVARSLCAALEARGRHEIVRLTPPAEMPLVRWRQLELPRAVRTQALDGLHSVVSAFAWNGPGRRVQTVHELPWKLGERENAGLRHRFWASFGARRADRVVTATETTARALREHLGAHGDRVRVCPWGLDPHFAATSSGDDAHEHEHDERVLAHLDVRARGYVLVPGGTRAKKNAAAAARALDQLSRVHGIELDLIVSGPIGPEFAHLVDAAHAGSWRVPRATGVLAPEDYASLVRRSAVVCVLSRSEGFGFGALEALACGAPLLVRAGSASAEVAGDAAFAVEPEQSDSVVDALRRALVPDPARRARGIARAAEFTWERSASVLERVWDELA